MRGEKMGPTGSPKRHQCGAGREVVQDLPPQARGGPCKGKRRGGTRMTSGGSWCRGEGRRAVAGREDRGREEGRGPRPWTEDRLASAP